MAREVFGMLKDIAIVPIRAFDLVFGLVMMRNDLGDAGLSIGLRNGSRCLEAWLSSNRTMDGIAVSLNAFFSLLLVDCDKQMCLMIEMLLL